MKKNILVYYQNPYPSIFIESLVVEFQKKGYNVKFLTKSVRGILHERIEANGIVVSHYNPNAPQFFRFILHWWFLIGYCRKNKIDIVFSQLQLANLVALLAQYFIRAKVYPCRHHVDEVMLVKNKTAMRIDKAVNKLAKKIIVVANAAKRFMVEHENVKPEKIVVIPLGYNFNLYHKPDPMKVMEIKKKMNCHLLLILIARMTAGKRHIIALQVLDKLIKENLDIKLLVLDKGAEENNLRAFVKENGLEERILFTGFLNNTMDYVAAADLLIHPSVIEASNQVVKEAALLDTPCMACRGIGDFDEIITDRENGFLVSKENTVTEMSEIIREYYGKKDQLKEIGKRLKKQVLNKFSIETVIEKYLELAE